LKTTCQWSHRLVVLLFCSLPSAALAEDPPPLRWGTDPTGGAPYVYKPKGGADAYIGFEVEFAEYLAKQLGRTSKMVDGTWKALPELLEKDRTSDKSIDIVLNGYELRKDLADKYGVTRPYYIYRLQLVVRKDNDDILGWTDLPARGGRPAKTVGVLGESVASQYTKKLVGEDNVLESDDVANVMEEVKLGKRLVATVQDNPAAVHFTREMPELRTLDEGRQPSYYVIYLRKDDTALRDQIDAAIRDGLQDGSLKKIYERYGLWNEDQERLRYWSDQPWPPFAAEDSERVSDAGGKTDWPRLLKELLRAAGMTVLLALVSFPIAMLIGLLIAVGRVYGSRWIAIPLSLYVEVVRGTPLLLQLYVLFYMLPKIAPFLALEPFVAGVLGLAINYAAYEAENYRAGLLAIPKGQMEAALALGMSPFTAIRRVIVPQAVRLVVPPVTNDFIALFKDTSVCSVILITELTRKYNELYNFNRDLVIELAFLTAGLYLLMSYPLSLIARRLEKRTSHAVGGTN
jgi:polar amino acid transport system substrate-binding protein